MERTDHAAMARHMSVPLLHSKPSEFLQGPRFFLGFGFEEDGQTLNYVTEALGEGHLVYGSDYCHEECHFPDSLKTFTAVQGVSDARKRDVLGEAAKRLYRRI
jgi:predicted TIM-barrel fold metal-dependent hydrolase